MNSLPTYHPQIMMEDTADWFTQHPSCPQTGMTSCKAKRLLKRLAATNPKSDFGSVNRRDLSEIRRSELKLRLCPD